MSGKRGMRKGLVVIVAILMGGVVLGLWLPATTRQGVNFHVKSYRIPLYVKALSFVDRHWQYGLLARQITQGLASEQARARALFEWTSTHVRPTPAGFPVIDDHILHIIIRGYGQDDQMADVFTTLATYDGLPAFWRVVKLDGGRGRLVLSCVRVAGHWTLFDVANHLVFADPQGELIDVAALIEHPALVQFVAGSVRPRGVEYHVFVERLRPFTVPNTLRAEKQMPWPRLVFEARRLVHATGEAEAGAEGPLP